MHRDGVALIPTGCFPPRAIPVVSRCSLSESHRGVRKRSARHTSWGQILDPSDYCAHVFKCVHFNSTTNAAYSYKRRVERRGGQFKTTYSLLPCRARIIEAVTPDCSYHFICTSIAVGRPRHLPRPGEGHDRRRQNNPFIFSTIAHGNNCDLFHSRRYSTVDECESGRRKAVLAAVARHRAITSRYSVVRRRCLPIASFI